MRRQLALGGRRCAPRRDLDHAAGDARQHYLLAAHLIQVLILMGPVPALLLLSLPRNAGIAPRSVPLPLRLAVHPIVAIIAVNAGFIVWHLTPAYDAALAQLVAVRPHAGDAAAGVAALLVADRHAVLAARREP